MNETCVELGVSVGAVKKLIFSFGYSKMLPGGFHGCIFLSKNACDCVSRVAELMRPKGILY